MGRVFNTKVVGTSAKNPDKSSRQKIIRKYVQPGDQLKLKPEPNNEYDPNAIAVFTSGGRQIGYLSEELAERYVNQFSEKESPIRLVVTEVTGGVGEKRFVGVNVELEELSTPEERRAAASHYVNDSGCFVRILKFLILAAAAFVLIPLILCLCVAALSWLANLFS